MSNIHLQTNITSSQHSPLRECLNKHPLYDAIHNENNLRIFMEHHVYAVWDFMSLIKSLQIHLAPTQLPWVPPKNSRFANFINRLVLEEESDHALTETIASTHASHFESYCQAMVEIGANIDTVSQFINTVSDEGLVTALQLANIPEPAKHFMEFTFEIIERGQVHLLAAVLAYSRENLVPHLFRSLHEGLQISPSEAPNLHAYLDRHIQLDEQEHGPLAVRMVQELCEDSIEKQTEALEVAEQALAARLEFWNGIHAALPA